MPFTEAYPTAVLKPYPARQYVRADLQIGVFRLEINPPYALPPDHVAAFDDATDLRKGDAWLLKVSFSFQVGVE